MFQYTKELLFVEFDIEKKKDKKKTVIYTFQFLSNYGHYPCSRMNKSELQKKQKLSLPTLLQLVSPIL